MEIAVIVSFAVAGLLYLLGLIIILLGDSVEDPDYGSVGITPQGARNAVTIITTII